MLRDLLPEDTVEDLLREHPAPAQRAQDAAGNPLVRCPNCGKLIAYRRDNPFRPFCSERCKLLDLGAWAEERRYIPAEDGEESADEIDALADLGHPAHSLPDDRHVQE